MKLVKVEWWDHSSTSDNSWKDLEQLADTKPLPCISVGWVIKETKDIVVLVAHRYLADPGFIAKGCGDLTILKKAIRRMRVLEHSKS